MLHLSWQQDVCIYLEVKPGSFTCKDSHQWNILIKAYRYQPLYVSSSLAAIKDFNLFKIETYRDSKLHSKDGVPAVLIYNQAGRLVKTQHFEDGIFRYEQALEDAT